MADMKPVVDIDINYIFYHLHETAKEMADAVSPRLEVLNTSVDQKAKAFAPSEADIICQLREKNMMELDAVNADGKALEAFKQECFKSLQKYCEFFFGQKVLDKPLESGGKLKDLKSMVTIDKLVPVYLQTMNESVDWRKPLIENLFSEADDGSPSIDDGDASNAEDEPEPSGEESSEEAKVQTKVKGYKFQFDSQIAGQKKTDYANATSKFFKKAGGMLGKVGKAIFGNAINDFKNGSVKVGFHDVKTGEIASKALGALGSAVKYLTKDILTGIDRDEFAQNLSKVFVKKYPWTDIRDVKAIPSDIMKQQLLKQKKLDAYLQKALDDKSIRWPIKIVVSQDSDGYSKINQQLIADAISEAFKASPSAKQAVFKITGGIKNLAQKVADFRKDKDAKKATKAVYGKNVSEADDGPSVDSGGPSVDSGGPSVDSGGPSVDSGGPSTDDPEEEVKQTEEKANKAIKNLQGEPDAILKGLYLVKDCAASGSKDSIQNKIVNSYINKYIDKLNGSRLSAKKTVNEEYKNPVVGSLISTLFEDDPPKEGDSGSAAPAKPSSDKPSAKDAPAAEVEPVKRIIDAMTDSSFKKEEWIQVLNGVFAESGEKDTKFDVKKLGLSKLAPDGKAQPIEDHKALAAALVEIMKKKEPEDELERFFSRHSKDVAAMKELARRIETMAEVIEDSREQASNESSKNNHDWYVYCNPVLKDKSDKDEE